MNNSKLLHSFFLFFFFISFATSSSSFFNSTHKCSAEQSLALLLFKQNLFSITDTSYASDCQDWLGSGYYPIMMKWNKSVDCCAWDGVTCNHFTGDVIALDLNCGMLRGTIHPNTTLFHLPRLLRLNLALNYFYPSQLAHEIGRFSNSLTHLNISYSGFTGQIPSEISLLSKLVSLDLSWNEFDFKLEPHVFNNLLQNSTHLRELSLAKVNIFLVLPTCLNISSLKLLDLGSTSLLGKLPDNIFNLQYLEKLDLSRNYDLTGPLPKFNLSVSNPLEWLDLSLTRTSGEIPDSIGHLKFLNYLDLSYTNLAGEIPYSIGHLKSLNTLRLSSSGLMGSIPKSLVNLRHLTVVDLSDNMLIGTLPSWLFTLPSLEKVYLDDNIFSGSLPSELFDHRLIKELSLRQNQLVGEIDLLDQGPIPQSFRKLINLTFIDLSFNNFTGVWELNTLLSSLPNLQSLTLSYSGLHVVTNNDIHYVNPDLLLLGLASCKLTEFPAPLRAMKKLQDLDISSNEIHGHIPDWAREIGGNQLYALNLSHNFITGLPQIKWDGLEYFFLQSNLIQGAFPPSICNMSHLRHLDMSNNSFGGVIPQCLGNIGSSLVSLNVKSNLIQGPFPPSICNMSHLEYLDMSNNNFGGTIPQCFGNISSSLVMVDMANNRFRGIMPNVYEDCGQLYGLILNGNQLEGEVPSSLSKCQSLIVLDLGNNRLNGTFPGWLGDLRELQVLVLKSNNLHGPIETSSKIELPFPSLRVLDLSHNGLVGHLPQKYFENFKAMKNVVRKGTKPEYLNIGGLYYSIVAAVKGVEQNFLQISVDYTIVDLSNNRFEREIPDIIGSLNSLIVLNLSHNSLTGQIPHGLGNLSEIESLDLSWNQLIGEIPQRLADLTFLEFLNLSQNHLVGRIPEGKQFNTFEWNSFRGNPKLCGLPLPKTCEHPHEPQLEADGDTESGFTWRVVMLGYGCGTILGLVMGHLMLSTGRPKWFNAIAHAGEHMIQTRLNKRRYVYIGK